MTKLLTELADYDTPESWEIASRGWPEIRGDEAYLKYEVAIRTKIIPYGSYVLVSHRGWSGATESVLRVHKDYLPFLLHPPVKNTQLEFEFT